MVITFVCLEEKHLLLKNDVRFEEYVTNLCCCDAIAGVFGPREFIVMYNHVCAQLCMHVILQNFPKIRGLKKFSQ